jgi:hypothetical protein
MEDEIEQRELDIVGWWVIYDEDEKPVAIFPTRAQAHAYAIDLPDFYKGLFLQIARKRLGTEN